MKRIPRVLVAFFASALLVSAAFADIDSADYPDYEVLNKFPALSGEELKQVLFTGKMPPNVGPTGVSWEIHNPFRDKLVEGIIVSIEWKGSASNQATVVDVFIRASCGPLSSDSGHLPFFNAEEAIKASPRITLKEVRYASLGK